MRSNKCSTWMAAAFASLLLCGCFNIGGGGIIGVPPLDPRRQGFLPFVSNVSGPALAVGAEPVMVNLELSATLYPDLLRADSIGDRENRISMILLGEQDDLITLLPFLEPCDEGVPPPQGAPFSEFSFNLRELQPDLARAAHIP